MMELQFKQPTPGDIGWVISMHGEIYGQEFQFAPQFEIDVARKMVLFFDKAHGFNQLLIALVNGQRAGSIAISNVSESVAFINFILVVPEFRGQGVATALGQQVIHRARQHNFTSVRLETYSCLAGARKLYESLGFSLVRRNPRVAKYGRAIKIFGS